MEVTIQIIDMKDNIIELVKEDENYYLVFKKYNFKALAYIGENGLTLHHHEGDKKTQIGTFRLGVAFGIHDYDEIKTNLNYMKINANLYWVDDVNSIYYNKLIDSTITKTGWNSGEHLIDFPKQYEYAIEIKINPKNVRGNGSAVFIHCFGSNCYTAGCIAIDKDKMIELFGLVDKETMIKI